MQLDRSQLPCPKEEFGKQRISLCSYCRCFRLIGFEIKVKLHQSNLAYMFFLQAPTHRPKYIYFCA